MEYSNRETFLKSEGRSKRRDIQKVRDIQKERGMYSKSAGYLN